MPTGRLHRTGGFTLIEVLIVLTVLAILSALVVPRYWERVSDARETVLLENLVQTRKIIDEFYRDHQRYPKELKELVDQRYLRDLPMDPILERKDQWTVIAPNNAQGVMDIRSSAPGKGKNGIPYKQW